MVTPSENELPSVIETPYVAGSSLGSRPLDVVINRVGIQQRGRSFKSKAAEFRANQDLDYIKAPKVPDPTQDHIYLAHGCISLSPSEGGFVVADSSNSPTPGALIVNKQKSEFTSTAQTTKVGTPDIKTLTGLQMNPFLVRRPSTGFTPQRGWLANLFPVLSTSNIVEWAVVSSAVVGLNALLKEVEKLNTDDDPNVHRQKEDLGTTIRDNQDFERMILEGTVGQG